MKERERRRLLEKREDSEREGSREGGREGTRWSMSALVALLPLRVVVVGIVVVARLAVVVAAVVVRTDVWL